MLVACVSQEMKRNPVVADPKTAILGYDGGRDAIDTLYSSHHDPPPLPRKTDAITLAKGVLDGGPNRLRDRNHRSHLLVTIDSVRRKIGTDIRRKSGIVESI